MSNSTVWQQSLHDDVWLIGAGGRLDHSTVPYLEDAMNQLVAAGHIHLVVDFSQVNYVNSGGLRVLVSPWRTVRKQGGDVYLCGLSSRVREIFEMVGFQQIFQMHPTPADAGNAMIESWNEEVVG